MRLTNIETYVIKTGEPNLGGLFWFFIKLETDEGIVGWGEPQFFILFWVLKMVSNKT